MRVEEELGAQPDRLGQLPTPPDGTLRSLASRPLTDQVRHELTRSISNGAFSDGRLPSEAALAQTLSVSRTTLRSALRSLEEEGMLTRHRGRGTRINQHVARGMSLSRMVGFYDLIAEAGFEPRIADTEVWSERAEDDAAGRLGAPSGLAVMRIKRTFLANGNPAAHVVETVAADRVRGLVTPESVPALILEFAERFCAARVDHSVVEIVPMAANGVSGERLRVTPGTPYMRLAETHYSEDGEAFVVSDVALVDAFIRFHLVRRRLVV